MSVLRDMKTAAHWAAAQTIAVFTDARFLLLTSVK
jgi:hypothetical protein